jgi:hypothetical protein
MSKVGIQKERLLLRFKQDRHGQDYSGGAYSFSYISRCRIHGGRPSFCARVLLCDLACLHLAVVEEAGPLETWLQSRTLPGFFLFVGLGLMMIIIEETIAGITVHLLSVKSLSELPALVTYSPRLKAGASTVHMAAKANLRLTATQVVR